MSSQEPGNPYEFGLPIKMVERFYGRQDLVGEIVNTFTRTRQNAIVLHGQRRIGKTSLLFRLRQDETLRQDHLPIFFDLQGRESSSPGRILLGLAQNIADELSLSIPLPDEASLSADHYQFQRVFLPQIYNHLDGKRLLILCDEFDVITPLDKSNRPSADMLLGYLQTLVEAEQQYLAFIFTVGPRLDLLSSGYQRLFKGVQAKRVGRLDEKDTYNLLTERGLKGSLSFMDEALAEIWALTRGHPYLTQLIGFEIFNRLQEEEPRPVSAADVTACLDKAMEHGHGGLNWFWEGLNRGEQLILTVVADLTDRGKSVSDVKIDDTLQKHLLFLTETARRDAYKQLLEGDFLQDTGGRRYQFAVEFIRLWVAKNHTIKAAVDARPSNSEARLHYQLGLQAVEKGKFPVAIDNYRKALELDGDFVDALMALAPLLRDREIQEAIKLYERAYHLDPPRARDRLIELRLDYAHQLETEANHEAILEQAWSILGINPNHPEARELVGRIYLQRIETSLTDNNLAAAWQLVQELVKPVPIIQDANVGQRLRELWLDFSHKLTQQKPPNWDEAQRALNYLDSVSLADETIRMAYNRVTLGKACALLEEDQLDPVFTILQQELKPPLPANDIKKMLLGYSRQQAEHQTWTRASQALIGLRKLIDDADGREAQQALYHEWGDARLTAQAFDEAIAVYQQGAAKAFKPKIADAHLRKAKWWLDQDQLAEAGESYGQALDSQNSEATQEQARDDLKIYFDQRRQKQSWPEAEEALRILLNLKLAGDNGPAWQMELQLDQAKAELDQEHLPAAFQRLAPLGNQNSARIKHLIKDYVQKKARSGDWKIGAATLESLKNLLTKDRETSYWYENWLFLWAKALFPEDKLDKEPAQAKALCSKILEVSPAKAPLLDLFSSAEVATEIEAGGLRRHVCMLAATIALAQAQTCLNRNNQKGLDEAVKLFEEAMQLPIPPENLRAEVQLKLQTFSENQWLKENAGLAQAALKAISDLKIGGPEISKLVTSNDIQQVRRSFKDDQLAEAFSILNNNLKTLTEADRQSVKAMVYQFSRIYAGRDRWKEAKQTLEGLWQWLIPAEDGREVVKALDVLNWEWLDFTRGKHLAAKPMTASSEEIEGQIEDSLGEIQVILGGYEDAKTSELKLETLDPWAEELIKANLHLGDTYLADNDLTAATQAYHRTLSIECQQIDPEDHISRSLRNYSERMLHQPNWDEARLALEKLKSLNLPPIVGRTQPDPRIDGAIQRVILAHAQALLKENEIENTFAQLQALPDPWPEGELKQTILKYSQNQGGSQEGWPRAILALEHLDQFLVNGHQEVRDQEALGWLVTDLEAYGQFLEKADQLSEAADIYHQGLECTRDEAKPRSPELADHYIRVELEIAQRFLARDPLTAESPAVVDQAIQCYQNILGLPEHTQEHEDKINEALRWHVFEKLVKARQPERWERARQMLDHLDAFYPTPSDRYKRDFAVWRRDLAFAEVQVWLAERRLEAAFVRLEELKRWLSEYSAPKVSWHETEEQVKALVYHQDFCQAWLHKGDWELATQALADLEHLIPNDSEIIGWQVDALCQWAQALSQKDMTKAIYQYEQALEKAPKQQAVSPDYIETLLLSTQLAQAGKFLKQEKLADAGTIYEKILQKPADYLNRAVEIRKTLKDYSDDLAKRLNWDSARQALEYLLDLGLDNEEVSKWRQNLALHEMQARLLGQDDLNVIANGLAVLTILERPLPLSDIQAIVNQYTQERAKTEKWKLAIDALKDLGYRVGEDGSARQWVIEELMALGKSLEAQGNRDGRILAFKLALEFEQWASRQKIRTV